MVRQQVIFAEVVGAGEVRAYLGRLRRRFPLATSPPIQRIALEFKIIASDYIKKIIPANRRTNGGLADSFVINEEHRPNGIKVTVYNSKPYAPFIDLNDITTTGHGRKLSHKQIMHNTSLSDWFRRSSTFYTQEGRLPRGTTIGMSGGDKSFHKYSVFSKYPQGIRFTNHAFREVMREMTRLKRDILKEFLRTT